MKPKPKPNQNQPNQKKEIETKPRKKEHREWIKKSRKGGNWKFA